MLLLDLRYVCQNVKGRNSIAPASNLMFETLISTNCDLGWVFWPILRKCSAENNRKKAANSRKKLQKTANPKSVSNAIDRLYSFDVSSQLGQASMSCPGLSCTTLVEGIAMTCPENGRSMKSSLEAKIQVLGPTHIYSQNQLTIFCE